MPGLGLGLRATGRRRKPAAIAINPLAVALASHAATIAMWDVTDKAARYQDRAGAGPRVTAAGQSVGRVKAYKGGAGFDLVAPSDAARPLSTAGLTFDGGDDKLAFAFAGGAGPASATIVSIIKTGAAPSVLYAYDGGNFGPIGQSGVAAAAGGSAGGTVKVDGVTTALRDDLFTAAYNGAAHIVQQLEANFAGFPSLMLSGYPGLAFAGVLIPIAILDPAAGDYAGALADALAMAGGVKVELAL